jgi:hypothetical protein
MSIHDPTLVVDVMDEHEVWIRIDDTKNSGRGRPGYKAAIAIIGTCSVA